MAAKIVSRKTIDAKAMQVLMGICAGITADGVVNDTEVHFLSTWLTEHDQVAAAWPGDVIADRVRSILSDGLISEDERTDLLAVLTSICGSAFTATGTAAPEIISIPYDETPTVNFKNRLFCFTGKFAYGTRSACERATFSLGGRFVDRLTRDVDYLIIGTTIEKSWINTTYGRKIEAAIAQRKEFGDLKIISEHQWTNAMAANL